MLRLRHLISAPALSVFAVLTSLALMTAEFGVRSNAEKVNTFVISAEDGQEDDTLESVELPDSLRQGISSLIAATNSTELNMEQLAGLLPPDASVDLKARAQAFASSVLIEKKRLDESIILLKMMTPQQRADLGVSFIYAKALKSNGDIEAATQAYLAHVNAFPNHQASHINLGIALAEQERHSEAIEILQRAADITSGARKGKSLSLLGISLSASDRLEDAEAAFEKSIEFRPTNAPTWRRLAETRSRLTGADPHVVVETFRRADAISSGNWRTQASWATYYMAMCRFDAALVHFRNAYDSSSTEFEVSLRRAINLIISERPRAAGRLLENVKEADLTDIQRRKLSVVEDIISYRNDRLKQNMVDWPTLTDGADEELLLILAHVRSGALPRATKLAEHQSDATYGQVAQFIIAREYVRYEEADKALPILDALIQANTTSPYLYRYRGRGFAQQNRLSDSLRDYQFAYTLNPNSRKILIEFSDVLRRSGRARDAIAILEVYLSAKPRDTKVLEYLADTFFEIGDFAEASTAFSQVYRRDPTARDVGLKLASAQLKTMNTTEAIGTLTNIIDTDPSAIKPRLMKAQALMRVGELELAKLEFERVLKLDPSNDDASQGQSKVKELLSE